MAVDSKKIIAATVVLLVSLLIAAAVFFAVWGTRRTTPLPSLERRLCSNENCANGENPLPVLLVSMDGFRAEYLQRKLTPTLQALKNCGVHIPFMYPSFPSKTFPNHYSIVTGLFPESHGIIDNKMFDPTIQPESDQFFTLKSNSSLNPAWWLGEPIWNTVMKNGWKAATMLWPGSQVKIQGIRPTYWLPYNKSMPFESRVNQVVDWLTKKDVTQRPKLVVAYFHQPDASGHQYGPVSPQVNDALREIDDTIEMLLEKLSAAKLLNCINIVVVADHGMQLLKDKDRREITLDSILKDTQGLTVFNGTTGRIMIDSDQSITATELQRKMRCRNKNITSFARESNQMPRRLHYAKSRRIGDIVVKVEPGYYFTKSNYDYLLWGWGDHGYDYRTTSMHAVFMAHGPAFKKNISGNPFQNVEINYLLHDLLQMPIKERNNGTEGTLRYLLKNPPRQQPPTTGSPTHRSNARPLNLTATNTTMEKLMRVFNEWSSQQTHGRFKSLSGSVFDYDNDGLADTTNDTGRRPSHYYLVLFWERRPKTNRVLSFVLPNENEYLCPQFMDNNDYYFLHTARIRDIELLTGLEFMNQFPVPLSSEEVAALRVHVNDKLWWR